MANTIKEKVIPKENAVFWLDKNGCWRNAHGKFEHHKIIEYFHSCIKYDQGGYYLSQVNGNCREKVYFPYEDQALFVFDVIRQDRLTLILNTKKRIELDPDNLFIREDNLYMRMGEETVKFIEHGLIKIAPFLEDEKGRLYIRLKDRRYRIPILDHSSNESQAL
ncbi:MAG: MFS transporter permease [Desulfobacterales bacterium]|jgi:hypothetical protein